MQGMRSQGVNTNEPVQPNIYYDQMNPAQQYQPPAGGQGNNGYAPNHNVSSTQQPAGNGKQVLPLNTNPLNTQDVRFMEGSTGTQGSDPSTSQSVSRESQGQQWSPNTNTITYHLRELYDGAAIEELAMAVTTRAMRGSAPIEDAVDEHANYSSDDVERPQFDELGKVASTARQATRAVARENQILDEERGQPVIHDLEDSDIGQWEGPGIPMDDVATVKEPPSKKAGGYDLWYDLSSLKADITFGQLLEISPIARKTLKEGMPVNRRVRKAKTRTAAGVQSQGLTREVKAIDIEVMIVDKVVPNVLVNGGSGLNIMPEHTLNMLGLQLTGPSPFIINMANQTSSVPIGMVADCRIQSGGEEYIVNFHVIKIHSHQDTFPILLGKPWLRMADAVVAWGGVKPSITYGPAGNMVKVAIVSLGRWVRKELTSFSDEGKVERTKRKKEKTRSW